MAVSGFAIGKEWVEALGLPPETKVIQMRISLEEAVTVTCKFYPTAEGVQRCLRVLQRYTLAPKEGPPVDEDDARAREYDREVHERPAQRARRHTAWLAEFEAERAAIAQQREVMAREFRALTEAREAWEQRYEGTA